MSLKLFISKSGELKKYMNSPTKALRREHYTIIFTGSEAGTVSLNKKLISFPPHTFIFVSPSCFLGIPENQLHLDFLHFSKEFYIQNHHDRDLLQNSPIFPEFTYTSINIPEDTISYVHTIIYMQYNAFNHIHNPIYAHLIHNLLEQALLLTAIKCNTDSQIDFFDEPNKIIVNLFKELIGTHIHKTRTVKFYSDKLNMTSRRLSKATQEVIGKTPKEVITAYIISQLKWQLANGEQSIKEIGRDYGFLDDNNFSSFFTKEVGLTPKEYRKSKRKKKETM